MFSWQLLSGASAYQTESVGILRALRQAATTTTEVVIHTDPLFAINTLFQHVTSDNTSLLTQLLHAAVSIVHQGRSVTLRWLPVHVGISGNEQAD